MPGLLKMSTPLHSCCAALAAPPQSKAARRPPGELAPRYVHKTDAPEAGSKSCVWLEAALVAEWPAAPQDPDQPAEGQVRHEVCCIRLEDAPACHAVLEYVSPVIMQA